MVLLNAPALLCKSAGAGELPVAKPSGGVKAVAANPVRRLAIERELDRNQAAVKQLYEFLDAVAEDDQIADHLLKSQIRQFDDRNAVLFDQLDALDRQQLNRKRKNDWQAKIRQLANEAQQFRAQGRPLQAIAREARRRAIQKALDDGTWQQELERERSWGTQPDSQQVVELKTELKMAKAEIRWLRKQVAQFYALLQQQRKPVVRNSSVK